MQEIIALVRNGLISFLMEVAGISKVNAESVINNHKRFFYQEFISNLIDNKEANFIFEFFYENWTAEQDPSSELIKLTNHNNFKGFMWESLSKLRG